MESEVKGEQQGVIRIFRPEGYGFIKVENQRDYFFHIREFVSMGEPEPGTAVSFKVGPPRKSGRQPEAINVRKIVSSTAGESALANAAAAAVPEAK